MSLQGISSHPEVQLVKSVGENKSYLAEQIGWFGWAFLFVFFFLLILLLAVAQCDTGHV